MKPKVRIDFCDFWDGFNKTNNYFYNVLRERFDVILSDRPEFIIYSNYNFHLHRVHNCVKIYFGVEADLPDWRVCDYALTYHYLEDARHLRLPFYVLYGDPRSLIKKGWDVEAAWDAKSRFCAFLASNPAYKHGKVREHFFHHLSRRRHVDSGGRYLNNIGGRITGGPRGKLDWLRDYRFHLCFENASILGYTSEKIFEAMMSRCIPVYWGSPRVHEEFNPRSFLNYADFDREEALVERILELDDSKEKWCAFMREPFFHDDTPNKYFDRDRLLDFFERVFGTPVRPVCQRKLHMRLGRWMVVRRNKAPPRLDPNPDSDGDVDDGDRKLESNV